MEQLVLIVPEIERVHRLKKVIEYALEGASHVVLSDAEAVSSTDLREKKILFVIPLGESGINMELYRIMKYLRTQDSPLAGSVGGIIIDGDSELYTKSVGRSIVFTANRAGCRFPGRCLVEATGSLKNYNIQAMNQHVDNFTAYQKAGRELVRNIMSFSIEKKERPNILMLHASDATTSNTLAFWNLIKKHLKGFSFTELSLRNGQIMDCRGCDYETCKHFSDRGKCFYGGTIVEDVFPAVLQCDALVMVCPNYNDALSGNLTAFINRLTSLFVNHRFYDKYLYAVIVSGYSGGDIVAEQLISGLNMNKTFSLPGKFAIMETAHNPKAILEIEDIAKRAEAFAEKMKEDLLK